MQPINFQQDGQVAHKGPHQPYTAVASADRCQPKSAQALKMPFRQKPECTALLKLAAQHLAALSSKRFPL